MNDSFWEGGPAAYAKALKDQYGSKLESLKASLKECQDKGQQNDIRREIDATKLELKKKLRAIKFSRF